MLVLLASGAINQPTEAISRYELPSVPHKDSNAALNRAETNQAGEMLKVDVGLVFGGGGDTQTVTSSVSANLAKIDVLKEGERVKKTWRVVKKRTLKSFLF